ncbi:MAG: hypothetical protein RLZZ488_1877 [Pseudomonadota bacterium]|jgi:hypothetical protein
MTTNSLQEDVTAAFTARLARLERAQERVRRRLTLWSQREDRFALIRLLTAVALVMVLAGFYKKMDAAQVFSGWLCFFVAFFTMSAVHRRLKRVRSRCEGLAAVFAAEMARLQRDWQEIRKNKSAHFDPLWQRLSQQSAEHPYKSDFDLSGLPALWLDTCTLEEGSSQLADELLLRGSQPLAGDVLLHRTQRADELARRTQALRRWESYRFGSWAAELYKVRTEDSGEGASDAEQQLHAAEGDELNPESRRNLLEVMIWLCVLLQLFVWTGFFLPQLLSFMETADVLVLSRPLTLFFPLLIISTLIWETWRRKVQMSEGSLGLRELKVLNALEDVQRSIPDASGKALVPVSAGRRFRFLRLTFELGEVRRNPIVWLLLNVIVPYDAVTFAITLMAHRAIDGRFADWWKDVVAFDFHAALARVKTENHEFVRAERDDAEISAVSLAHPLLPAHQRIGNDLLLDSAQRCLLLTGSNMAGKSTLLRALGMNALLAQMGCVVCARKFKLPRLEVLCAIQVSDSLESGASYFYAEVRRLVRVLERLQMPPDENAHRLFLIDEIFRGTNNRERFLGSWQVIEALLKTGAFGVLTTHDLALTRLEDDVEGVRNFHLRETVGQQGMLEFDYLLRRGPCPTTNALIIMQQAGLPVELNFQPQEGGKMNV